jgi:hypothetical protein
MAEPIQRIEQLEALLRDYYTAEQMRKRMNEPTPYDIRNHEELAEALQQRTAALLGLEEGEEITCACGTEIRWLIGFFGHDYQKSHISDCPDCGEHTLHVSDESQCCMNPACKHRSGVDAEGNVYRNGEIVSNSGKSVEQLRQEYFDGASFLVG